MKHIYRSDDNRIVGGICGGLGEYFDVDPTLLRLLWLFVVVTGVIPGFIVYGIAFFVVPRRSSRT